MSAEDAHGCALVTGAATGIGRAIALALGDAGYTVVAADRDREGLTETVAAAVTPMHPVTLDLASETGIMAAFDSAVGQFGEVTCLVNNAGIALPKPATEVTWEDWDAVMAVNLKAAFFLSQRFAARRMGKGLPGAVINIGSTHGIVGVSDRSVYGISKAAILHMTRMLAIEWAGAGIRVNAVAPGTVMTPSREAILEDPDARARALDRIPSGRFPTPEEVAAAVVYLAGPSARSVTGHVLVVDGGTTVC
ncbi:SDR family NAD(P)-dependent oxidoreductase [Amorphus coralli]|uniref:SDR family NAD(P)-dependent oxidoreductase n=1 Tax=Amorphus coralli TaxID=340680 RepID=UPI00036858D5|nr:SDR family oxidoreductase [Amorphus coralli]